MKNLAVILTVFNRKEKTLRCLRQLSEIDKHGIEVDIYLTDDGCTDGTHEAVEAQYPDVIISKGTGSLYWSGGMNLSWKRALASNKYDGYLWLNDDTYLKSNLFEELLATDEYCTGKYARHGIYVGSTTDHTESNMTYGGSVYVRKWSNMMKRITPNGDFQECHLANGNILYVPQEVVDKIGCLYEKYVHGADYDYTYWAHTQGFPLIIMRNYVGICDNDHKSVKQSLMQRNLKERIKFLYSPTGLQLNTAILFQKRFFPYRVPYVYVTYWLKTIFPQLIKS